MPIITDNSKDIPIIKIQGEFDARGAVNYKEEVIKLILDGKINILSDLSEMEYIDSSGIGVFLSSSFSVNKLGGEIIFQNPQMHVKDLLESTQVIKYLKVE